MFVIPDRTDAAATPRHRTPMTARRGADGLRIRPE